MFQKFNSCIIYEAVFLKICVIVHIKLDAYTAESEYVQKACDKDNDFPWVLRTYKDGNTWILRVTSCNLSSFVVKVGSINPNFR